MPLAYNIRVMSVRIIIITHSDRALFDLNALVSFLGKIVPAAYGLEHYFPGASMCYYIFRSRFHFLWCTTRIYILDLVILNVCIYAIIIMSFGMTAEVNFDSLSSRLSPVITMTVTMTMFLFYIIIIRNELYNINKLGKIIIYQYHYVRRL